MKRQFSLITAFLLISVFSVDVIALGSLENPKNGSVESGVAVISGWYCDARQITIKIDERPEKIAAYGTDRGDTANACGDINNGFGLLFNVNLFGDGMHRLRAYADGVKFADVNFTVSTLGQNFLRGITYAGILDNFPFVGDKALVQWVESKQNFVIADSLLDSPTKSFNRRMTERLLGEWIFSEIVGIAFGHYFRFYDVFEDSERPGSWFADGFDILDRYVIAGYFPEDNSYALLDVNPDNFDRFYDFNFSSEDVVVGTYYQLYGNSSDFDYPYVALGGKFPASVAVNPMKNAFAASAESIEERERSEDAENEKSKVVSSALVKMTTEELLSIRAKYLDLNGRVTNRQ